jgi:hypothetical protein
MTIVNIIFLFKFDNGRFKIQFSRRQENNNKIEKTL